MHYYVNEKYSVSNLLMHSLYIWLLMFSSSKYSRFRMWSRLKRNYIICLICRAKGVWKEPDNAEFPGVQRSILNGSSTTFFGSEAIPAVFLGYDLYSPFSSNPLFLWFSSMSPSLCLQEWQSGHLGSTLTTLGGMETMSAWKRSVFITGREFVHARQPWKLALQTGWRHQRQGKLSIPVWRKASGALTRNNPTAVCALTTMSAFSVPQVALMTALTSQIWTFSHYKNTYFKCL